MDRAALLPDDVLLPDERRRSMDVNAGVRTVDVNAGIPKATPRPRAMGIVGSVTSVMNAVIGTGILALPVAFSKVGTGLGTIVMLVCAIVTFVTLLALGWVAVKVGAASYGQLMVRAVGPRVGRLTSAMVAVYSLGICVAFSLVIAQNLTDLLFDQEVITKPIIPGPFGATLTNRRFWIVVPTCFVVIPLCMLPNYESLRFASTFATLSMTYLTAVIVGYCILAANRDELPVWGAGIPDTDGGVPRPPIGLKQSRITNALMQPGICCVPLYEAGAGVPGCDVAGDAACCSAVAPEVCCTEALATEENIYPWAGARPFIINSGIFTSFSTFLASFFTHTMIPQVVAELAEPSLPRLSLMMGGVSFGSFALYYLVGLSGYLLFGTCVCDNISVSFGPNLVVALGQGFVVMSVCAGYPTFVWPCRDAILELCYPTCRRCCAAKPGSHEGKAKRAEPSLALKRTLAAGVVVCASGVAWFSPPFQTVLAVLGAVGGGIMGFILPSLAFLQVAHGHRPLGQRVRTLPALCLLVSTVFTAVNIFYVLRDVFDRNEDAGDGNPHTCLPPNEL